MILPGINRFLVITSFAAAMLFFHSGAYAIGPTYSGSWYNPEQSGHGFSLEYIILNDGTRSMVVYWYVYDSEGNPVWLIGQGEPMEDNTVTLQFAAPYGMVFGEFDPDDTVRADGGIGIFTFENADAGVFDYEPSAWMVETHGVSAISTPVVKLAGVALEEPLVIDTYVETYVGSWKGRMEYDRSSPGICHDADIDLQVGDSAWTGKSRLISITVIRDSGAGQATYNWGYNDAIYDDPFAAEYFTVFGDTIDMNIQFPAIDSYGRAEGYWNYSNSECYGVWAFSKE